ncbi:MAG TPA: hypothetical protein VFC03_19305, partial [Acidimicrobiales bacterium]|nr:hypothetical protein [Acidimicrobiales bacterium]
MSPEPAPTATTGPPLDQGPGEPPWRPSRVRVTHRRSPAVTPRRGMVALPALASGVGLALSLP